MRLSDIRRDACRPDGSIEKHCVRVRNLPLRWIAWDVIGAVYAGDHKDIRCIQEYNFVQVFLIGLKICRCYREGMAGEISTRTRAPESSL